MHSGRVLQAHTVAAAAFSPASSLHVCPCFPHVPPAAHCPAALLRLLLGGPQAVSNISTAASKENSLREALTKMKEVRRLHTPGIRLHALPAGLCTRVPVLPGLLAHVHAAQPMPPCLGQAVWQGRALAGALPLEVPMLPGFSILYSFPSNGNTHSITAPDCVLPLPLDVRAAGVVWARVLLHPIQGLRHCSHRADGRDPGARVHVCVEKSGRVLLQCTGRG